MNRVHINRWQNSSINMQEHAKYQQAVYLCQQIINRNSKSFSFASKFLPTRARADAAVLYAWCRRVDDAIDESPSSEVPAALARLNEELTMIYLDQPLSLIEHDTVLMAFRDLVKRLKIPKYYPQELLEGMKMDVDGVSYPNLHSLYRYCYRVASVVGLMMCHVLGIKSSNALNHAAHLGIAMQLTNICRDVSEDWGRGRLYLPLDMLRSNHSLGTYPSLLAISNLSSPLNEDSSLTDLPVKRGQRFTQVQLPSLMYESTQIVISRLLNIADHHYRIGFKGLKYLPWRASIAIHSAGVIYQDIGRVISDHHCDPHQSRAMTTTGRKVWLGTKSILLGICRLILSGASQILHSRSFTPPDQTLKFEKLMSQLHQYAVPSNPLGVAEEWLDHQEDHI